MSRKKGMSADEKMLKMKEVFLESGEVLTGKEVEKLATKSKGINGMQVKDILQSVVDEGWVSMEKIGSSNYYWAFPSQELNNKRVKVEDSKTQIEVLKRKKDDQEKQIESLKDGREETEERKEKLARLEVLRKENDTVKTDLQKYAENDPDYIRALEDGADIARESANRWTDNIFSVRSWCTEKFSCSTADFNQNFEVDPDLDYVE